MDGILNINKPAGKTSFNVVASIKRLTGEKHVGHAGTLDPMAKGVLPICLGQATRLVEYLMDTSKTYYAVIELGITTDSYDSDGKVTKRNSTSDITIDEIKTALKSFRGTITQIPPMYSAIKQGGKPLYKLARTGIDVPRKQREVKIFSLEIRDWQNPLITIEVTCGKGTYIRSLANDLGQMLGCGAILKDLERSKYGVFDIKDAIKLDNFADACRNGYWESLLYPMDSILSNWETIIVGEEKARSIRNGVPINLEENLVKNGVHYCRAYTCDGNLLSILRFNTEKQQWQPRKVFG
jgi:tRNA pseudouridine55 synthase